METTMSRVTRSNQRLTALASKENIVNPQIKEPVKAGVMRSKIPVTKGNSIKYHGQPINISIRRPHVLRDRTNIDIQPKMVILKKGEDTAKSTAAKSTGTKRTISGKSKANASKIVNPKASNRTKNFVKSNAGGKTDKNNDAKNPVPLTITKHSCINAINPDQNIHSTKQIRRVTRNNALNTEKNDKKILRTTSNINIKVKNTVNIPKVGTTKLSINPRSNESDKRSKSSDVKQTITTSTIPTKRVSRSQKLNDNSGNNEEQNTSSGVFTQSQINNDDESVPVLLQTKTEGSEKATKRTTRSKTNTDANNKSGSSRSPTKSSLPNRKSARVKVVATRKSLSTPGNRNRRMTMKATNPSKKFFKNKPAAQSKIALLKQEIIGLGRKNIKSTNKARVIPVTRKNSSFHLRQATLPESFARKSLRPRSNNKNYCEDTVEVTKHISPENGNIVPNMEDKKIPIYKRLNLEASKEKDKDKVYELDIDDKNDVAQKKRKKLTARNAPAKRPKIKTVGTATKPKTVAQSKVVDKIEKATSKKETFNTAKTNKPTVTDIKNVPVPVSIIAQKESSKTTVDEAIATDDQLPMEVETEIHAPPSPNIGHDAAEEDTVKLPEKAVPRIILNEELSSSRRINITGTPLQPKSKEEDFSRPFREKNAFNMKPTMQLQTMMDHSLLRQSLSPIRKAITPEIPDAGSPWRPIIPITFSRVQNVFQSTPQGEKYSSAGKLSMAFNRPIFGARKIKIVQDNDVNANVPKENNISGKTTSPVKKVPSPTKKMGSPITRTATPVKKNISPIKNLTGAGKSPRKFGTVISNLNSNDENSGPGSPVKSPRKFGSEITNSPSKVQRSNPQNDKSPKQQVEAVIPTEVIESCSSSAPMQADVTYDEAIGNKENSAPNDQNSLILQEENAVIPSSPPRDEMVSTVESVEIIEPQPGPSGLQKVPSPDAWNLKQSNLNKYLNLADMPESTRINTGIFDEAHSVPISGKAVKKLSAELDAANAFGFDEPNDDDSNDIKKISPTNKASILPPQPIKFTTLIFDGKENLTNVDMVNNDDAANPARLSIREIKKTLKDDEVMKPENIPDVNQQPYVPPNEDIVQAIQFSNTFDMEDDKADKEKIEENVKEIGLFVDLEPNHFNQPPRFSYKRKRSEKYDTSVETEEESDDGAKRQKRPQKKKKIGKAQRKENKKLDNWAKSMNKSFDEIENFDLVVE